MLFMWWFFGGLRTTESYVLDPALYLSPSPPLVPNIHAESKILWAQPIDTVQSQVAKTIDPVNDVFQPSNFGEERESMEEAETFWPHIRSSYTFPIQFHLTGTYGGYDSSGAIASSYASMSGNRIFGRPLAGSGYGSYGSGPDLKIFGGNKGATWTGWGNGKWGHYGKGK